MNREKWKPGRALGKKPERWNGPQERPKQPSRKREAITKARGRFNNAETREQNTGGRDSGFFGETKTVEGFAGCRGGPWELPWENSGGAGETRGTGLELRYTQGEWLRENTGKENNKWLETNTRI